MKILLNHEGKLRYARLFFRHLTPALGILAVEAVLASMNSAGQSTRELAARN